MSPPRTSPWFYISLPSIWKASLKHLTFKTVFLLALGSGKRSEIHAWVHRNIRHQEDWSNVSLYPSPGFISKNHLAKKRPNCVAPVIIPALAPTLDKSLKEDRTLCPVRALGYYFDRTNDLWAGKVLVFVSFRKSFNKDIVPATVSSWIKQTIVLCYQLLDEQARLPIPCRYVIPCLWFKKKFAVCHGPK